MFLIIFVKPDCKEIGVAGEYRIMETCERLYLFFIPTFGWNRQYFAVAQDGTAYPIREEAAKAVKSGEKRSLAQEDFTGPACEASMGYINSPGNDRTGTDTGRGYSLNSNGTDVHRKKCPYCGFSTTENFTYCPKCAEKLEEVQ